MSKQYIYTFRDDLKDSLKDPKFKKAWEKSETEYQLAVKIIETRLKNKMSQRDLAKKMNTSQAAISRVESMNGNPSLSFLKRVAGALGTKISIGFN